MTDKELAELLRQVTKELKARQHKRLAMLPPDPEPFDLCADLFATQEAVRQAIIDNNCEPL